MLEGTKAKLRECGVRDVNIVVQSVPGAWELPTAVQRLYAASQIQSTAGAGTSITAGDLLGASTSDLPSLVASSTATDSSAPAASGSDAASTAPFDAIVAIGVLIKGETMHFEYISDSVSHGLMRVGLDTGVPVVFGVLTVLNDTQARARAGLESGSHNHGEDWGLAAVEMGAKRREWAAGKMDTLLGK